MKLLDLLVDGEPCTIETAPGSCVFGGHRSVTDLADLGHDGWSVIVDGVQHTAYVVAQRSGLCEVAVAGKMVAVQVRDPRNLGQRTTPTPGGGPQVIRSPMPGRVLAVHTSPGDHVERDQGLVVVEAMKMQNELRAPRDGTVTSVSARAGDSVSSGDVLVVIE